jgi:hypothetical protein
VDGSSRATAVEGVEGGFQILPQGIRTGGFWFSSSVVTPGPAKALQVAPCISGRWTEERERAAGTTNFQEGGPGTMPGLALALALGGRGLSPSGLSRNLGP